MDQKCDQACLPTNRNGREVHLEGPTDSAVWNIDDRDFKYLVRNCMHMIQADLQRFGYRESDSGPLRKRQTTIYSTDLHLKRNFTTPKTKGDDALSLEEDGGSWSFWYPTYPSKFCDQIMATLTSHKHEEQKCVK